MMKNQKTMGDYVVYALCCLLACFVWTDNAYAKVKNLNYSGSSVPKSGVSSRPNELVCSKLVCDGFVWITSDAEGNTQVFINDDNFSKEAENLVVLSELQSINTGSYNASRARWDEIELQVEAVDQNHSINVRMDGGNIGKINMGNNKPSYQNNLDITGGHLYRFIFTGTPSGACTVNLSNCYLYGEYGVNSSSPSKLTINIGKGVTYAYKGYYFEDFYDVRSKGAKLNIPLKANSNGVYEICDLGDYYWFESLVNKDGKNSINAKLLTDITPIQEVNIGTSSTQYKGLFDGNGHTITINYRYCTEYTGAVFGQTGEGCKVYNLTVRGSISGSQHFYGGIIGRVNGTTEIKNCNVQVNISSTFSGDNTHGGLIAVCAGNLTVSNTLFAGSIVSTSGTNCGGMLGWLANGTTAKFNNSAVCATFSLSTTNGSATFSRTGGTVNCTNCYYTNLLGRNDGATQISADEVTNGNLCYKLNGKSSTNTTWRQNLGFNGDPTPVLDPSHKVVNVVNDVLYNDMTTSNGWYEINNDKDYYDFSQIVNKKIKAGPYNVHLNADIALGNYSVAIGTSNAPFSGRFEGNGHSVTLNINNDLKYQGLIGCCNGTTTIKNVTMMGSVSCSQYAGLVGGSTSGTLTISSCTNYANVTTTSTGNGNAAGIYGVNMDSSTKLTIENCLNVGTISGREAGGISGWIGKGTVRNCLNIGKVTGTSADAFARKESSGGKIENSYCYKPSGTVSSMTGATTVTEEELKSGKIANLLNDNKTDGTQTWYQTLGEDAFPILDASHGTVYSGYVDCYASKSYNNEVMRTEQGHHYDEDGICIYCHSANPEYITAVNGWYEIGTVNQLKWFSVFVNEGNLSVNAKLIANIVADNLNWIPIGTVDNPFAGTFDGQGFSISGLNCNDGTLECTGLFGKTGAEATIKHLKLSDCLFSGGKYAGSICGWNEGTLLNCLNQNAAISGQNAGGICGRNSGTISNCLSTGNVSLNK